MTTANSQPTTKDETTAPQKLEEKTTNDNTKEETTNSKTTEDQKSVPKNDFRPRGNRSPRRREREQKEFEEKIVRIDRVTRVVKGGRRMRFRVSVVIGDKKGRVGFGIGKSAEVFLAVQKAVYSAKKSLITVPLNEGTVAYPIEAKFKASFVHIFPAPKGKGVIAGGSTRKVLELVGFKDVLSKIHGSRNVLNVTYATFSALKKLRKVEVKTSEKPNKDEKKVEKAEKKIEKKVEIKSQKIDQKK